jgi:hypothetical protein
MAPPRGRLILRPQVFHETGTGHRAGLLARAGWRSRGRVRTAAKWETGDDRCSSTVAIGQGRSLPGGDGQPRPTRQPAARTSFAPGGAPSRRESTLTVGASVRGVRGVDTHKGRSWGGPGVRYTSPLALAGGNIRAATPCASAQLQHPSPGRTTVASSHPA